MLSHVDRAEVHTKAVLRDKKAQREEATLQLSLAEDAVTAALAELPPEQPPERESLHWPGNEYFAVAAVFQCHPNVDPECNPRRTGFYRVPKKYDWSKQQQQQSRPELTPPNLHTPTKGLSCTASLTPCRLIRTRIGRLSTIFTAAIARWNATAGPKSSSRAKRRSGR